MYQYKLEQIDNIPQLVKEKSVGKMFICSSENVASFMREQFHLENEIVENVYLLALNTKGRVNGVFHISKGDFNGAMVNPKNIFMSAILVNAHALVLVHNHPSGICKPSSEDIRVTEKIKEAGQLMDIALLDHVIIPGFTSDRDCRFYSFKENNLI